MRSFFKPLRPRSSGFVKLGLIAGVLIPIRAVPAEATVSVGYTPAYPGSTVAVPIQISRATNVVAAQYDVAFDPNKVSGSAPELALGAPDHVFRSREVSPGVYRVLLYSLNNAVTSNRVAASMPFSVPSEERNGSGPIAPRNAMLVRPDATAMAPVRTLAGAVFVRPVNPLPDGTVQLFMPSQEGTNFVVQATTDLVQWTHISTNVATGELLNLLDLDASNHPFHFYRWRQQP